MRLRNVVYLVVILALLVGCYVFFMVTGGPEVVNDLIETAKTQPTPKVIEKEVEVEVEVTKIVEIEVTKVVTEPVYIEVTPEPSELGTAAAPVEVTVSEAEPENFHLEKDVVYSVPPGYTIVGDTSHLGMRWPDSDADTGQIVLMEKEGEVVAHYEGDAIWEGGYENIAKDMLISGCIPDHGCEKVNVYGWPSGKVITTVVRPEVVAAAPAIAVKVTPSPTPSAPITITVALVAEELPDIFIGEKMTETVPAGHSCVGDIRVGGKKLHDDDGDTGLVVHFEGDAGDTYEVYAEYGASCTAARSPETLKHELETVSGCGPGRTCDSAEIKYWPLPEEGK